MKEKQNYFVVFLLVIFLLTIVIFYYRNNRLMEIINYENRLKFGDTAYQFNLKALSGSQVSIKNKMSILIFFNASCSKCLTTLPVMNEQYDFYKERLINVIGISKEGRDITKKVVDDFRLRFPVIPGNTKYLFKKYKVSRVPRVIFIDKKGVVRYFSGYDDNAYKINNDIKDILNRMEE